MQAEKMRRIHCKPMETMTCFSRQYRIKNPFNINKNISRNLLQALSSLTQCLIKRDIVRM